MAGIIDTADRAYWWLRQHPPVAAAIAGVTVALILALALLGGHDAKRAASAAVPASAVASVGDLAISKSQLAHWRAIYLKTASGSTRPTTQQATTAAFALLAGSAWITQEARRQHVSVTGAQVAKAADDYLAQAAAATKATRTQILAQLGTTLADVRYQQRSGLLAAALQKRVVGALPQPTSAQISAAYAAEPQRWARPSQRDVQAVVAADQAAATAALAALRKGASFTAVTRQYSTSTALGRTGGVLKNLKPGANDPAVERPVFAAPVGVLQGPVRVNGGWLVFKVRRSTPLAPQTLAAATGAIRQSLSNAAQAKAVNSYLTALRARWRVQTRCSSAVTSATYCGAR